MKSQKTFSQFLIKWKNRYIHLDTQDIFYSCPSKWPAAAGGGGAASRSIGCVEVEK